MKIQELEQFIELIYNKPIVKTGYVLTTFESNGLLFQRLNFEIMMLYSSIKDCNGKINLDLFEQEYNRLCARILEAESIESTRN